jgi:hypothetical protein
MVFSWHANIDGQLMFSANAVVECPHCNCLFSSSWWPRCPAGHDALSSNPRYAPRERLEALGILVLPA